MVACHNNQLSSSQRHVLLHHIFICSAIPGSTILTGIDVSKRTRLHALGRLRLAVWHLDCGERLLLFLRRRPGPTADCHCRAQGPAEDAQSLWHPRFHQSSTSLTQVSRVAVTSRSSLSLSERLRARKKERVRGGRLRTCIPRPSKPLHCSLQHFHNDCIHRKILTPTTSTAHDTALARRHVVDNALHHPASPAHILSRYRANPG